MPELDFQIIGVEATANSMTPLLHFKLAVTNTPETELIHAVLLQVQIQFETPRRSYNVQEKAKLLDLFGTPDQWGHTLRNRLWTHASVTVSEFHGNTEVIVPVTCTYDLNIASAKYLYALEQGDAPLLFLFSGTVFYAADNNRMQVQRISWDKECRYQMPIDVWQVMMEDHYPGSGWISLRRDTLDRLYAYRREHGLPTWEEALDRLLPEISGEEMRS